MRKWLLVCVVLLPWLAVPQAFGLTWLTGDIQTALPDFATLVLDSQNRAHMLSNSSQFNYASCDAGCQDPANWSGVSLAPEGFGEMSYEPRGAMAVDAAGNPRVAGLLVTTDPVTYQSHSQVLYGSCDAGCSNLANWTIVTVAEYDGEPDPAYQYQVLIGSMGVGNTAIAVDGNGGVHIVYGLVRDGAPEGALGVAMTEVIYASCAAGCDDPSNWTTVPVRLFYNPQLGWWTPMTVDNISLQLYEPSPGQVAPRLLVQAMEPPGVYYTPMELHVLRCNGNCSDPANWLDDLVAGAGQYGVYLPPTNFALDASGAYHLALAAISGTPQNPCLSLHYLKGYSSTQLYSTTNLAEVHAFRPSIGVDSAGAPRIAYCSKTSGALMYYSCDANCSDAANWSSEAAIPDIKAGTPSLVMAGQAPQMIYLNGEQGVVQYTSGIAPPPMWSPAVEAEASVAGRTTAARSRATNLLALILLPAALVVGWTWARRRARLH